MLPVLEAHLVGQTTPQIQAALAQHVPTCVECLSAVQVIAEQPPEPDEAPTPGERPFPAASAPSLAPPAPPPPAPPVEEPAILPGPVRALIDVIGFGALAVGVVLAMLVLPDFFAREDSKGTDRRIAPNITISEVRIARVRPDGRREPLVGNVIAPKDRLAFAYAHTSTWERLMVFVVDEKNEVYWQLPEWTDRREPAYAPTILSDRNVQALPVAAHRDWEGKMLSVHVIFTRDFITTRQVEEKLSDPNRDRSKPLFEGTLERITLVTVDPAAEKVGAAPQDETETDPFGSEAPDRDLRLDTIR